jgi:hypothetical protein
LDYFAPIILPDPFAFLLSGSYSLATHSLARFFPPYGGLRLTPRWEERGAPAEMPPVRRAADA